MYLILSGGHTSSAPGAKWKNLIEYQKIRELLSIVSSHLTKNNIPFSLVKSDTLPRKVNKINQISLSQDRNCLAVDFHFNAAGDLYVEGTETLHYPGSRKGKELAEKFHYNFVKNPSNKKIFKRDRGVKEGWYNGVNNGRILYYLRDTNCPAIVIEPLFMCQLESLELEDFNTLAIGVANSLIKAIS